MQSDTLAGNAIIKQQQSQIWLDTKVKYMKESNTHAGNATIKQQQSQLLLDTKGQYMKESNTLADSVQNNSRKSQVLENTKKNTWRNLAYHKDSGLTGVKQENINYQHHKLEDQVIWHC